MTPDANDLCVFAVKRGVMKNRLDINYNLPQYTMLEEKLYQTFGENLKRISDIADVICGPFGSAIKNTDYQDSGIPLVRITNINKDGYMNYDDLIYISEKLGDSLSKTQVSNGDIVVSQRGSLGQCAIVDDSFPKMNISANIIAIKNINGVSVSFLHDYFLSTVGQTLLERSVSGQVQSKITTQDIADLLIPVNTDETKLTDLLDSAYKSYKRKLQQADKLQRKNPTYLIERLGLTFDYSETQKLTYATTAGSIEGRIDADYYSPKFSHFRKQIEALPYRTVSVNDISEKIVSGFAAGKQDQADNLPDEQRVPHLRPFSITPEGELSLDTKKYVPRAGLKDSDYCKKNEIIFNNTNSPEWVGKTTVFDSDVLCAASNHMTRITVKEGVNPYYVAAFFNVLLSIGYWKLLCTNFNNQAGVNTDTLKRVKIPLPPKEIQDQIAAELMQRRSQANVLRRQAIKEWADAKAQFEKELLGE